MAEAVRQEKINSDKLAEKLKKDENEKEEKLNEELLAEYANKYKGFYKSIDSKIIKGVFGGLGHKIFNGMAYSGASLRLILIFEIAYFLIELKKLSSFWVGVNVLFYISLPIIYIYAAIFWRSIDTKNELSTKYGKIKQLKAKNNLSLKNKSNKNEDVKMEDSEGKKKGLLSKTLLALYNSKKAFIKAISRKTKCTHCGLIDANKILKTDVVDQERFQTTVVEDQITKHKDRDGNVIGESSTPVHRTVYKVKEYLILTCNCNNCLKDFEVEDSRIRSL